MRRTYYGATPMQVAKTVHLELAIPCARYNRVCYGCQALKGNFPAALWRRWWSR